MNSVEVIELASVRIDRETRAVPHEGRLGPGTPKRVLPVGSGSRVPERAMLAAVLLIVFGFPMLWSFPLTDPDEGLHARIAWEMVETGDWVTPRFLGKPFYDKPVLFFWASAGSLALFGHNEIAARLPALLFGLLGLASTWAMGRVLFHNRTVACLAAILLSTSIHHIGQSQVVVHDIALVPFVTLAIASLWQWDVQHPTCPRDDRHAGPARWAWLYGAGGSMGLACLTKGLLGLALPALVFTVYLSVSRRLTLRKLVGLGMAGALGALVASPWYLLMESANPGYLKYFLWERHVLGFVTEGQRHGGEPIWYYLPVLFVGAWPWAGYLPAALRCLSQRRRQIPHTEADALRPRPLALLVVWIAVVFGFFSLASSKLPTYILPVYPALALLLGEAWHRHLFETVSGPERLYWSQAHRFVCIVSATVVPAAALATCAFAHIRLPLLGWVAIGLVSALAVASWRLYRTEQYRHAFFALSSAMPVVFLIILTLFVPPIAELKSHDTVARFLRDSTPQTAIVLFWHDHTGSAAFYGVGANLEKIGSLAELSQRIQKRPIRLVVKERGIQAVEQVPAVQQAPFVHIADHRVYVLE